jgi:hypothetical protein
MQSSVCRILALHLHSQNLMNHAFREWRTLTLTTADLFADRWLFAYEAPLHGWTASQAHIHQDPWYSAIAQDNVRFYVPSRTLKPLFRLKSPAAGKAMTDSDADLFKKRSILRIASANIDASKFLTFSGGDSDYDDREDNDDDYDDPDGQYPGG